MADMSKLPVLDNIQNIDQLKEYVYKLEKQIRFVLQHLDEDNLSADLIRAIKSNDGNDELMTAIEQNSKAISMKASKKTVDGIGGRVRDTEASLTVQANEIALIVEQTEPGVYAIKRAAIVASINERGESGIKLAADAISLEGYTTVNDNFKILLDGSIETVNATLAGILNCLAGNLGGLSVNGDNATMLGNLTVNGNLRVTGTAPSGAVTPEAAGIGSAGAGRIVTVESGSAFGTMPKNYLRVTDGATNYDLLLLAASTAGGGGTGGGGTSGNYIVLMQSFSTSVSLRKSPSTDVSTTGGHMLKNEYYIAYANTVAGAGATWYNIFSQCTISGTQATLVSGLEAPGWALLGSSVTKITGVTI